MYLKKLFIIMLIVLAWKSDSKAQFGYLHFIDSSYTTGSDLAIGDLNNDGLNDLIIIRINDNILGYYLNNGSNNYSSLNIISNSYSSLRSLRVFDSDNDGDLDIFAFRQGNGILRFRNDGNNVFTDIGAISGSNGQPTYFKYHDMDMDGDLDIIAATTYDDEIEWYKNNGNNSFTKYLVASGENYPKEIAAGDFDADGDLDIVVGYSNGNNKIGWFENVGGNTYGPLILLSTNLSTPTSIEVHDFDNNGLQDIVFCSAGDDHLAWFRNIGGGTFDALSDISTNLNFAISMNCSDFDKDGDVDIIAGAQYYEISIFENRGNGNFVKVVVITDDIPLLREIRFADIAGSASVDVVGIAQPGVFMIENFKDGYFLKGISYYDENANNVKDPFEANFAWCKLIVNNGLSFGYANLDGNYAIGVDTGYYHIYPELPNHWLIAGDSSSYSGTLTSNERFVDSLDFPVVPDSSYLEIEFDHVLGTTRCNTHSTSWLAIHNTGTKYAKAIVTYDLDVDIDFLNASPSPDVINGNQLVWEFDSITIFQTRNILMQLQMPGVGSMGDTLVNIAQVVYSDLQGDDTITLNDTIRAPLRCAYDPNEKVVTPDGITEKGFIGSDEWLEYTVYFQNTGNDTAYNILLKDTIDINLDMNTFEILNSSNNVYVNVNDRLINFNFDQIFLPDSNTNEMESHGFVQYKIKPVAGVSSLSKIENTCYIFFDYNPPIITNTTLNTICDNFPSLPVNLTDSSGLNLCYGMQSTLSVASSGNAIWYDLNGNIVNIGNQYAITGIQNEDFYVRDSTCFETDTFLLIHVNVEGFILTNLIVDDSLLIAEDTVGVFYEWVKCLNDSIVYSGTDYWYQVTEPGNYSVIIHSENCVDTSDCYFISLLSTDNFPETDDEIYFYPNPVNDWINYAISANGQVKIYNSSGSMVYYSSTDIGNGRSDLSCLSSGIYCIEILTDQFYSVHTLFKY